MSLRLTLAVAVLATAALADGGNEPTVRGAPSPPPLDKPKSFPARAGAQSTPRAVGRFHLLLDVVPASSARLFDVRDGSVLELALPMADLARQHPDVVGASKPGAPPPFWWTVLGYEPEPKRVSLLISTPHGPALTHFSVGGTEFERPTVVAPGVEDGAPRAYGFTPDGALVVVAWRYADPKATANIVTVKRIDLASGAVTQTEHRFPHETPNYSSPYLFTDPTFAWVAMSVQVSTPRDDAPVRFVEVATGAFFDVPAPPNAQSVTIDAASATAWIASTRTGVIQRVNLKTKKVELEKKGFGRVHSMVLSPSGKALLVMPSTSSFYTVDPVTLAVRTSTTWAAWLGTPIVFPWENRVAAAGDWVVITDVDEVGHPNDPEKKRTVALRWKSAK